jgi:hypothetical protein
MIENNDVKLYGKIAKFPKNVKAKNANSYLENLKISKNKLWYFIIERDYLSDNETGKSLQMIKYNNKKGVDCTKFLIDLKEYYSKNENMIEHINELIIDGNGEEKFSMIRNIPDIEIDGIKLINIITKDIIKLLHK